MILTQEHPLLRQVAKKVTNFASVELENLINKMFTIMQQKNGVGLAAPQIGVSERILVYEFDVNPRYPDVLPVPKSYLINPEILLSSSEIEEYNEGCLSVPNLRGIVQRPQSIVYKAYDLTGNCFEKEASGFEARIILHEIDHLNGILFIDKATVLTPKIPIIEKTNNL